MDRDVLIDILNNLDADNIAHVTIEYYQDDNLKRFEYHQIKK